MLFHMLCYFIPCFTSVSAIDVTPSWALQLQSNQAQLQSNQAQLQNLIIPLAKEAVVSQRRRLDVWTPSKASREENPDFKAKLITYYKSVDPTNPQAIKCMILNQYLPKNIVIGSHIYKASTYGSGLEDFGLKATDLYSERNGLLLYESIEKVFDVKEVCFLYNAFNMTLTLRVLRRDLLAMPVIRTKDAALVPPSCASLLFSDIDGSVLQLPLGIFPYKRILSWHARCSVRFASNMGWITPEEAENFQPYFDTSLGASNPIELEEIALPV